MGIITLFLWLVFRPILKLKFSAADFHSVEFSERTRDLLLARESVALTLDRMLHITKHFIV